MLQEESITLALLKSSTENCTYCKGRNNLGPYAVNILEQRQHISQSAIIA